MGHPPSGGRESRGEFWRRSSAPVVQRMSRRTSLMVGRAVHSGLRMVRYVQSTQLMPLRSQAQNALQDGRRSIPKRNGHYAHRVETSAVDQSEAGNAENRSALGVKL